MGVFLRYQTKQNTPFFFLSRDLSQEGRRKEGGGKGEKEGDRKGGREGWEGRKGGDEGREGVGRGGGGERKKILKFSLLEYEYAI